jgi:uncharacterized spore protein YtfJ
MSDLEEVRGRVQAAAKDDRLASLAQRVGASAAAGAVFGEPVEREGVTVIPVAKLRWGFGGGFGDVQAEDAGGDDKGAPAPGGSGGGGGVMAKPMGFIEMRDGHAQYKPLRDPLRLGLAAAILPASAAAAALVVVLSSWLAARSIRRAVRLPRPHLAERARAGFQSLPRLSVSDLPHQLSELPRPHLAELPHQLSDLHRPRMRDVWPLRK